MNKGMLREKPIVQYKHNRSYKNNTDKLHMSAKEW
jgi:hypothetical protein